jgi:hypothetical protein
MINGILIKCEPVIKPYPAVAGSVSLKTKGTSGISITLLTRLYVKINPKMSA